MDTDPIKLIQKVWRHSGIDGNTWMPNIAFIGDKNKERFRTGPALDVAKPVFPDLTEALDWYWTPAVSSSSSRKEGAYKSQRALWVDCDFSYDEKLLEALKPSFVWETSPGHRQAIWLVKERIDPSEYKRDGLMGMLTQALGADPSGVDIGQLLRVPGTWHHKQEPVQGRILHATGVPTTRGMLLSRVARGLGFSPVLASELSANEVYGDRSKVIWKFSRSAAELGIPESLTYKLLRATAWNKWKSEPERLQADVAAAYSAKATPKAPSSATEAGSDGTEAAGHWVMSRVTDFGPVTHEPIDWVLTDMIPASGCGLLVAPPKVGKTRVAIEVALGLASGTGPMGLAKRKPQAIGFLSLEDGDYQFAEHLATSMRDDSRAPYHWDGRIKSDWVWEPPQPMPFFAMFEPADFSTPEDQQRLLQTIQEYKMRLLIIDTLSMAIGKANVSDSKDMYSILKPLKQIAQATGCAILVIHHTRKRVFERGETVQEIILGSTALHGWADFILALAPPPEEEGLGDVLRLTVQTKRGGSSHLVNRDTLKVLPKAPRGTPE